MSAVMTARKNAWMGRDNRFKVKRRCFVPAHTALNKREGLPCWRAQPPAGAAAITTRFKSFLQHIHSCIHSVLTADICGLERLPLYFP